MLNHVKRKPQALALKHGDQVSEQDREVLVPVPEGDEDRHLDRAQQKKPPCVSPIHVPKPGVCTGEAPPGGGSDQSEIWVRGVGRLSLLQPMKREFGGWSFHSWCLALESDIPGLKSQLICLLAVWPWASHLPSLSLGFFIYKVHLLRIK